MIKIVVVDGLSLFRHGLVRTLTAEADLDVVGEARPGGEAFAILQHERPHIVLMDGDESGDEAEELLRHAQNVSPASRVIILTMHDRACTVERLLAAGARAYILKDITPEALVVSIRAIHREAERVIISVSRATLKKLREVILLVSAGLRNADIARHLYITEGTVKRHLTNIYTKLGAISRIDAVNKATAVKDG